MPTLKTARFWIIGLVIFLVVAVLLGYRYLCPKSDANIIQQKEFVVGVMYDYKPFTYLDENGKRIGFDIDVADEMCRHLELNCRIVPKPFYQLMEDVKNQKIDILVAGAWATEERKEILAFSDSYYRSRSFFITSIPHIHAVNSENAHKLVIGTIVGTYFCKSLQEDFGVHGARIKTYLTHADLIKAIHEGEINTMIINGLPGYALLRSPEGRNLYIAGWYDQLPEVLTESKIAVRKDLAYLTPQINEFLLHIQAMGRYQELSLKYFPFMNY